MQRFQQCTRSYVTTTMLALTLLVGFSGMAFADEDKTSMNVATVDVNVATAKQLEKLPGIGKTLAKRIISYRSSHGGFKSVQELVKVNGIGKATLAEIEELISTGHMSEGSMSEGSMSEGSMSEGSMSEGSMSEGSMSEGSMSEGSMSEGSMSEGSMSEGSMSEGHMSEGSMSEEPMSE